jgi:glycerate kinase
MKIIIASDSFKGSLTSAEVAAAATRGIQSVYPDCQVVSVYVADGGEGTIGALMQALDGDIVTTTVRDPLSRPIQASYALMGTMAIIEMAAASGLTLLTSKERNPWITSTHGTGEMIMDAIKRGCRQFLIGIGGSATNDAGTGMLQAMGFRFYDANNNEILHCCGATMHLIRRVDDTCVPEALRQSSFTIACDVDTPFCGKEGAAHVFAPQKGADTTMVHQLDYGMASLAKVMDNKYHINITHMAGAGAAGGMGGAFCACLNAKLQRGIDTILENIHFRQTIHNADLIITGEGKIDSQTSKGKVPFGVLSYAKEQNIPVIAIAGCVEECESIMQMGFAGVYSIREPKQSISLAMRSDVAAENVENTIKKIMKNMRF